VKRVEEAERGEEESSLRGGGGGPRDGQVHKHPSRFHANSLHLMLHARTRHADAHEHTHTRHLTKGRITQTKCMSLH
jgi:hypothetical protein